MFKIVITIQAVGVETLFKNLRASSDKADKEIATNLMTILVRALDIGAKNGNAAVSKNPTPALSTYLHFQTYSFSPFQLRAPSSDFCVDISIKTVFQR